MHLFGGGIHRLTVRPFVVEHHPLAMGNGLENIQGEMPRSLYRYITVNFIVTRTSL